MCCCGSRRKGKYEIEPVYEEMNDLRNRRTRFELENITSGLGTNIDSVALNKVVLISSQNFVPENSFVDGFPKFPHRIRLVYDKLSIFELQSSNSGEPVAAVDIRLYSSTSRHSGLWASFSAYSAL